MRIAPIVSAAGWDIPGTNCDPPKLTPGTTSSETTASSISHRRPVGLTGTPSNPPPGLPPSPPGPNARPRSPPAGCPPSRVSSIGPAPWPIARIATVNRQWTSCGAWRPRTSRHYGPPLLRSAICSGCTVGVARAPRTANGCNSSPPSGCSRRRSSKRAPTATCSSYDRCRPRRTDDEIKSMAPFITSHVVNTRASLDDSASSTRTRHVVSRTSRRRQNAVSGPFHPRPLGPGPPRRLRLSSRSRGSTAG